MVDTTEEWIVERTGIRERHIAADKETTCDLAEQAARRAIEAAGIGHRDIDLIIVATTTPDRVFPAPPVCCRIDSIFMVVRHSMYRPCAPVLFTHWVLPTSSYAAAAQKHALVVGAETLSRIVDWTDRGTCVLFGDGAGAVVISADAKPGIINSHLHADGQYKELLTVPAGISQGYDKLQNNQAFMQMQGNEVFKVAVNTLGRIVDETLEKNGLKRATSPGSCRIRPITALSLQPPASSTCPWTTWS